MKNASKVQLTLLALIVVVLIGTQPMFAQDQRRSCFGDYAHFVNRSWQAMESCIDMSKDYPWYSKIGIRQLCRLNWVSDAFQAEGEYVSCMSGFTSIF